MLSTFLSIKYGWRDSSILILGLITLFIACMIKINYLFDVPQNQYQYYAGSVLLYSATMITESSSMAIIAKTISPELNLGYWNAGLLGGCAELLGRTFGNVAFTVYCLFSGGKAAEPFYVYVVNAIITAIILVVVIVFRKKLSRHIEIEIEYKQK